MISGQFVPHHKKFLGIFLIGSPLWLADSVAWR